MSDITELLQGALDFMHTLPKFDALAEPEPADAGGPERTVGPYRVLRELGRGGMGTVWLAERVDGQLKRQVALKLPHPALATNAFNERQVRERDILAALTHPHIARLYDAGITDAGQPYMALAMDPKLEASLLGGANVMSSPETPGLLLNLAHNRLSSWHPDEAIVLLKQAAASHLALLSRDTNGMLIIQRTLAFALYSTGRFDESVRAFAENVSQSTRLAGADAEATRASASLAAKALLFVGRLVQLVSAETSRIEGKVTEADRMEADARSALKLKHGAVRPKQLPFFF